MLRLLYMSSKIVKKKNHINKKILADDDTIKNDRQLITRTIDWILSKIGKRNYTLNVSIIRSNESMIIIMKLSMLLASRYTAWKIWDTSSTGLQWRLRLDKV